MTRRNVFLKRNIKSGHCTGTQKKVKRCLIKANVAAKTKLFFLSTNDIKGITKISYKMQRIYFLIKIK